MSTKKTAITKPQNAMLAAIEKNGPMTDADLAEVLGGSPSSKNKTGQALVARGLLTTVDGRYALPRTEGTTETVTLVEAPAPAEDDHDHEEVAANMAAELAAEDGVSIRIPRQILAAMATMDLDEAGQALAKRADQAEVKTDGSVRFNMTADERDALVAIAEAILDDESATGAAKVAAKAKIKWVVKVNSAA